ncbi:MAG: calcium/proton exchanger [Anaerolineales bacterium]|nr:calcium/proton exchanger [Anaerolineales bacterium]
MSRPTLRRLARNPLYWLLILAPAAGILSGAAASPTAILAAAALAMIPMAGLIGEGTESLAAYTGPRIGGLLNATLGNAAELIICIAAIRAGLLELVKASITGSILGNLLLVLGISMLAGCIRNGDMSFDRRKAASDSILLLLAVIALTVPSLFVQGSQGIEDAMAVEYLSLGVAGLMLVIYLLGLVNVFHGQTDPLTRSSAEAVVHDPGWSLRGALVVLGLATAGVVWLSEILVAQVEAVVAAWGVSEFFLGVILVPLIGNAAEHMVAVSVALKKQMSLSMEIAVGSSLQIALFVVPFLVFASLVIGNPLTLVFNPFELIALVGAGIIATLVALDGEANWLEGAVLVTLYLILALAFFFLP